MSKNILIVESDSALSHSMRTELEARGFSVQETSDGKGSVELIRRERPDLVVMEVELTAGQNGYILCGKLKKDDELKSIPIIIVGNADGFAQHRKLKTRADDYVARPVDLSELVEKVGNLIGFPETAAPEVDESISLSDLVEEDEPQTGEFAAEEIAVDEVESDTVHGDPELDMLDAAFDDATEPTSSSGDDDAFAALESLGDAPVDESEDRTMVAFAPDLPADEPDVDVTAEPHVMERAPSPVPSPADAAELRSLRARVAELERAAREAEERAEEAENRARSLGDELATVTAELETARSASAAAGNKEIFALREAANRKDKEILRLKGEANEKDNEIVELRDKVLQLEQQLAETSGEMARRDAQIRTLGQKADQLAAERKRFDQQLLSAREEARTATAQLQTVQAELDDARARLGSVQAELDTLRHRTGDLESAARRARDEADELRGQLQAARAEADRARREAEDARSQLEQAQIDVDAAKNQLAVQAEAFAEEAGGLRQRIAELEEAAQKHEDRLAKFYGKIKEDEKIREKTRKALAIALQLLDEQQQARVEIDIDESVEA